VSPARRTARRARPEASPRAGARGGTRIVEGGLDGAGLRIAVVASRFNELLGERLLEGALRALERHGVAGGDVTVVRVPGAFEIPTVARLLARAGRHDAIVCVGAVLRGETPHFEWVAGEAARGIARAAEETGVPVLFGIVTVDTLEQALDRAGGKLGNRGADAASAAVEMAGVIRALGRDTAR
jgi:6,7-dimethyl-8-ribityllumazine synthase